MRPTRLLRPALAAAAVALATAAPAFAATDNIIVTYAGSGTAGFSGDGGQATAAKVDVPAGVVLDNAANVFFADSAEHRVRKVDAAGVITTVAGVGNGGFSGDGGPATSAKLYAPTGLAVSGSGVVYIADTGNNRVRKVAGGTITTVAGTGTAGFSGDGGPATAARLAQPTGLALDAAGNLYVADTGNNVVRKVSPGGTISTFAGSGKPGNSGNTGPATKAKLQAPMGLAASGTTLLISDTGNNEVRKVSGGIITDFAGTGAAGFSGDGGPATAARLAAPVGVTFDAVGNAYIVDAANHRVRHVSASGIISTYGGNGTAGFSGDGGPAELAAMSPLGGVSADAENLFVADTMNHRVRRIHRGGPPPALPEAIGAQTVVLGGSAALLLGGTTLLAGRARRRPGRPGAMPA